jgi:MFS family permease
MLLLTLGLAVIKITRYILPLLLPAIIVDLSITSLQAGIALSLINIFFALQQFPSGRLSDQLSRSTVILASFVFMILGCVAIFIAESYLDFLVSAALIGTGGGLYPPASRAWLTELFSERRGEAFGFNLAAVDLGGIVASGLAVVVLSVSVWRAAFPLLIMALFLIMVALHIWSVGSIHISPVTLDVTGSITRVARNARVLWLIVALSLYMFTIQGLTGFLPTFLQDVYGVNTTFSGIAYSMLFFIGIISKPLQGRISDMATRPIVGTIGLLLAVVGVSALIGTSSSIVAVTGVILFALGHKGFVPIMEAHLMDRFDAASMGGDLGIVRTIYWSIGSLGPAYVGYVSSEYSFRIAFSGFILTLFGGMVVVTLLRE